MNRTSRHGGQKFPRACCASVRVFSDTTCAELLTPKGARTPAHPFALVRCPKPNLNTHAPSDTHLLRTRGWSLDLTSVYTRLTPPSAPPTVRTRAHTLVFANICHFGFRRPTRQYSKIVSVGNWGSQPSQLGSGQTFAKVFTKVAGCGRKAESRRKLRAGRRTSGYSIVRASKFLRFQAQKRPIP